MDNKIKVGIIGFGKMGKIRKEVIEKNPALTIQGICDVSSPKKGEKTIPFFSKYQDLLRTDIDAVFVCTPNKFTPEIIIAALNEKKHVFSEKPPGRTLEDVKEIINAEKQNKETKLKFGFNHRYHDSVMQAKSIVDSGRYGQVLWLRGVYGKSGVPNPEKSWRNNCEIAGGGILLDQGIHMIDLFRMFCGEFQEVKSYVTNNPWNLDIENDAFALLRNSKNQFALLHSSSTQWKHKFSLEISLEKGYVNLFGILSSTRSYGMGEQLISARRQIGGEGSTLGNPQENVTYFSEDKSWEREIDDFVSCIQADNTVTVGSSYDALKSMELVYKIYQADEAWYKKMKSNRN